MPDNKNPLAQLPSFQEVLERASKNPAASRVLESANQLRERVDELSKKIRGIDVLEEKVASLEKRVAAIEKRSRRAAKPKPEASAGTGPTAG
jgi:DNA-binding FadR family transcriptional regulator